MMLRASVPAPDQQVQAAVDRLLREDADFSQNRRTAHRTPFTRPVLVFAPDEDSPLCGCVRNISSDGLGLLLATPMVEGQSMKLQIHTLSGPPLIFLAQVRWCVPFGPGWRLSGWKFIATSRCNQTTGPSLH